LLLLCVVPGSSRLFFFCFYFASNFSNGSYDKLLTSWLVSPLPLEHRCVGLILEHRFCSYLPSSSRGSGPRHIVEKRFVIYSTWCIYFSVPRSASSAFRPDGTEYSRKARQRKSMAEGTPARPLAQIWSGSCASCRTWPATCMNGRKSTANYVPGIPSPPPHTMWKDILLFLRFRCKTTTRTAEAHHIRHVATLFKYCL